MTSLVDDFNKKQEELHEVMENYPLFQEDIDHIYDVDIKEINDLLDKNDEYYLKKAIDKIDYLIAYIKDKSIEIEKLYQEFDKYAKEWENISFVNIPKKELNDYNSRIEKVNKYIKSHKIKDIKYAVSEIEKIIKEAKKV